VSYLAPVPVGTALRCEAEVISGGARVAFVEATVTNAEGKKLARASSTYLFRDRT
jgi:acyl-coenzyme A thioesterase PaaI-like protein